MKILLTNDDGIYSEGIQILKKHLDEIAKVTLIAPDRERSTISHAMTLGKPLKVTRVEINNHFLGYSIDGTPVDCVILGILELMKNNPPDLVISGINRGPNLGDDIIYSGTVSAAMEGAMKNIPSLAISLDAFENFKFESAALVVKKLVSFINFKILPSNIILNINIPNLDFWEIKGIKVTKHGKRIYKDEIKIFYDPEGNANYWLGGELPEGNIEPDTDFEAIYQHKVSITPLSLDLTKYEIISKIDNYFKNCNFLIQ